VRNGGWFKPQQLVDLLGIEGPKAKAKHKGQDFEQHVRRPGFAEGRQSEVGERFVENAIAPYDERLFPLLGRPGRCKVSGRSAWRGRPHQLQRQVARYGGKASGMGAPKGAQGRRRARKTRVLVGLDDDAGCPQLRPQRAQNRRTVRLCVYEGNLRNGDTSVTQPARDSLEPLRKTGWEPRRDSGEVFKSPAPKAFTPPSVRPESVMEGQQSPCCSPGVVNGGARIERASVAKSVNKGGHTD
jgi:hypothetical protein